MTLRGKLGSYELVEPLGSGAMGEVYKATDTRMFDRLVAIKLLPERFSQNHQAQERFRREVRVAASLQHPNIVTIHDHGALENRLYYVMEFIDGVKLSQIIPDRQAYPLTRRVDIAGQICSGLQFIHQAGVVHRDLKPGNVMVTRHGSRDQVKLLDFGIAQIAESDLTRAEAQPGTASYMSPEQARGEGVDFTSDIFSLGIVLYELVAGVHPFAAATEALVTVSILQETPLPMHEIRPDVPAELSAIVARALAKDPRARPSAAGEIEATLGWAHERLIAHGAASDSRTPTGDFLPRSTTDPAGDLMDTAPTTMPEYDEPAAPPAAGDAGPAASGGATRTTDGPVVSPAPSGSQPSAEPSTRTPRPGPVTAEITTASRPSPGFWVLMILVLLAATYAGWRVLWPKASTTPPAVVTAPPPSRPAATVSDTAEIREALEHWRRAYEARSVDDILEVFPTLDDPGGMRLYFSRMQWLQVATDEIRIDESRDGDTASAECVVSMRFMNVGTSEPGEVTLRSRFAMLRVADGQWRIARQEFVE